MLCAHPLCGYSVHCTPTQLVGSEKKNSSDTQFNNRETSNGKTEKQMGIVFVEWKTPTQRHSLDVEIEEHIMELRLPCCQWQQPIPNICFYRANAQNYWLKTHFHFIKVFKLTFGEKLIYRFRISSRNTHIQIEINWNGWHVHFIACDCGSFGMLHTSRHLSGLWKFRNRSEQIYVINFSLRQAKIANA